MALARNRRYEPVNYWPGFVDALSTMLLIIIFLLSVFMLSQYFLTREVTGKDSALEVLNRQIEELTTLLAMERSQSGADADKITRLNATLDQARKDKSELEVAAASGGAGAAAAGNQSRRRGGGARCAEVDHRAGHRPGRGAEPADPGAAQAARGDPGRAQHRQDLGARKPGEISDLGQRLNLALAQKVQELSRYRSDFFGRLRQILGSRPDIAVVGDRFVFQSSVLFEAGKADVSEAGKKSLDRLAEAALDLQREIPPDIPWILRIDGHTDARPVQGGPFKTNWELSAARAIAVAQYLISKGVDPHVLAAAGFGEFQPLEAGTSDEAYQKNRRIELKLTER